MQSIDKKLYLCFNGHSDIHICACVCKNYIKLRTKEIFREMLRKYMIIFVLYEKNRNHLHCEIKVQNLRIKNGKCISYLAMNHETFRAS